MATRISKKIAAPLALLALIFAGCGDNGSADEPYSPANLSASFEYRWGDSPAGPDGAPLWLDGKGPWKRCLLPAGPKDRHGRNSLWMRVTLPAGGWESPALLTSGIHQVCEVYLGKRPFYRFGSFDANGKGIFPGYKWFHLIRLPRDFGGRTLYFRFYSEFQSIGLSSAVIDSNADHLRHIVRQDILKFSLGIVFMILGFLVLLYYGARVRRWRGDMIEGSAIFLYFILASFSIGAAVIADTRIKELIVDEPQAWLYVRLIGMYVFVSAITGFIYHVFETRFRIVSKVFVVVFFSFSVLSIALSLAGAVPVMSTILPFNILVLVGVFLLFLIIVSTFRKGNRESYLFVFGIMIFLVTGVRDALVDLGVLPRYEFVNHWGMLVMVFSIGMIVVYRIVDFNRRYYGYSHEMRLARRIQMSVLPGERPEVPGMEVAAAYHPMVSIGGDFYSYRHFRERKLGVFISDISGHGVPSALISLMVKVIFDYESGNGEDPAALLAGMNDRLLEKMESNFLTACYAVIDLDRGRASIASAGHPPTWILKRSAGSLREIKPRGRLIGCFKDIASATKEVPIESGDKIIMITDGILEARNIAGEMFGSREFAEFIKLMGYLPAGDFSNALMERLKKWIRPEKRFEDDLTMVVVDIL